jgi:hypothetical protein
MLFIQRIHNKNKIIEKNKIIWIDIPGFSLIKSIEVSYGWHSWTIYDKNISEFTMNLKET